MKSIKNNASISDFDSFLCKLEEKEELGCFVFHSISHSANEKNNDEHDLTIDDYQNDADDIDMEDYHDDGDELDMEDDLDNSGDAEGIRKSYCWIVFCRGNGFNRCGQYTHFLKNRHKNNKDESK
ncbi:hypothetical protein AGMMS49531_04080 [Endomicrobiia bacterium]|nr:hypothetical protein AGMMS49531_04080 [Endomicrobiia bacterium]